MPPLGCGVQFAFHIQSLSKEVSTLLNKFDIQIREGQEHAVIETAGYLNDAPR